MRAQNGDVVGFLYKMQVEVVRPTEEQGLFLTVESAEFRRVLTMP